MFWSCQFTQVFWTLFKTWWNTKPNNPSINLSKTHVLYGDLSSDAKEKQLFNFTLIVAKWYIYRSFLNGQALAFDNFLSLLNEKIDIIKVARIQYKKK